jgi:chemotaxis family two-component system sensor kinase Cph1
VALQDKAAGVIFHSLGSKKLSVTWLRHQTEKEVHWAGDPEKAILKDEKGLHPRKSFSWWKEIVRGRSLPWLKPELNAAANFTHFLQRHIHTMFITEEEARYRTLSLKLQEANAELENINWISAHDLKEPLRKIQMFASLILEGEDPLPETVTKRVARMREAAKRMQLLIYDLLSYAQVSKASKALDAVNLNDILSKTLDELAEEIEAAQAEIKRRDLPTVKGIPFLLNQLFLNLLRNALKFHKPDTKPVITIDFQRVTSDIPEALSSDKTYYKISISDNGIGFDNEFKETIFDVFSRLNNNEKYTGSGIGLAVCKKIMHNHEGTITAHGQEGEGAVFELYFPG